MSEFNETEAMPSVETIYTPEVLEEIDVDDSVSMADDDDDMSTVMGDEEEENIEKQLLNETSGPGGNSMEAIGEEDDMANVVFRGHDDSVYCAEINSVYPGTVISGGGDDKAYIWKFPVTSELVDSDDQMSIEHCMALEGHTDTVTAVGFNYDSTMALTASYDGTVRIWNTTNGDLIKILDGPEEIEWSCWHSKGNAVIAGSRDGTIWMWLAHNGQCLQVFAGHDGTVTTGSFTSDGKLIVSGGEDGTVRVWAPKTGQCKHIFDNAHDGLVSCLAVSKSDPELILSGSVDGSLKLFHIRNKRVLLTLIHSQADGHNEYENAEEGDVEVGEDNSERSIDNAVAIEACGFCCSGLPFIASGGMNGELKIWDSNSGTLRVACTHNAAVVSLKWHESMPIVTTACLDNNVRMWDARNGNLVVTLTGHSSNVTFVSSSSFRLAQEEERHLEGIVSVSDDSTARFYATDLNKIVQS